MLVNSQLYPSFRLVPHIWIVHDGMEDLGDALDYSMLMLLFLNILTCLLFSMSGMLPSCG